MPPAQTAPLVPAASKTAAGRSMRSTNPAVAEWQESLELEVEAAGMLSLASSTRNSVVEEAKVSLRHVYYDHMAKVKATSGAHNWTKEDQNTCLTMAKKIYQQGLADFDQGQLAVRKQAIFKLMDLLEADMEQFSHMVDDNPEAE